MEFLEDLSSIETRDDLHQLCNRICEGIRDRLGNCLPKQLRSYNKVRKPIDLYVEHLVAMAKELQETRKKVTPLLFLPLDSQILGDPGLFTEQELGAHRLSRTSTYKDILDERTYIALQGLLSEKAAFISDARAQPFHVIYFDLIWNDRFRKEGGNLFETNVGLTRRCS